MQEEKKEDWRVDPTYGHFPVNYKEAILMYGEAIVHERIGSYLAEMNQANREKSKKKRNTSAVDSNIYMLRLYRRFTDENHHFLVENEDWEHVFYMLFGFAKAHKSMECVEFELSNLGAHGDGMTIDLYIPNPHILLPAKRDSIKPERWYIEVSHVTNTLNTESSTWIDSPIEEICQFFQNKLEPDEATAKRNFYDTEILEKIGLDYAKQFIREANV